MQELQKILDDPLLRYKSIYDVRWLSFYNAVSAVKRTTKSLKAFFENEATSNDDAVASVLGKQVSSYMFLAIADLLYNVLGELTRISKVFQKESVDFSIIAPSVDATIATILSTPVPFPSQLDKSIICTPRDAQAFDKLQKGLVSKVAQNLQSRFPQTRIISAMTICDPQNLPIDKESLQSYGTTELEVLLEYFSSLPTIAVMECKGEWSCLKQLASRNYSYLPLQEFWILIARKHKEQFPFLLKLAHACMAVPVSTAKCERGFSTQDRIKTKSRAAKKWLEKKERRIMK
jgi:hypothetical protein